LKTTLTATSLRQVRDRNKKVHIKPIVQSQQKWCSMCPLQ